MAWQRQREREIVICRCRWSHFTTSSQMNGARTLPGQGPTIGRFLQNWSKNPGDVQPILCRWSADVLPVSARVSHDYLTSHGARPTFGRVSVEASPGTGQTSHGGRRTCRCSALLYKDLLHQLSHHSTRRRKSVKEANGRKDVPDIATAFKGSEIETHAGWRMHITATPLHWPVWSQSRKGPKANRYTASAKKMVGPSLAHDSRGALSMASMRRSWQSCAASTMETSRLFYALNHRCSTSCWDWLGGNTSSASSSSWESRPASSRSRSNASAPSWIVRGRGLRLAEDVTSLFLLPVFDFGIDSVTETGDWSQWRQLIYRRAPERAPDGRRPAPVRRPVEIYDTKISAGDRPTCPMIGRTPADVRPTSIRCVCPTSEKILSES